VLAAAGDRVERRVVDVAIADAVLAEGGTAAAAGRAAVGGYPALGAEKWISVSVL